MPSLSGHDKTVPNTVVGVCNTAIHIILDSLAGRVVIVGRSWSHYVAYIASPGFVARDTLADRDIHNIRTGIDDESLLKSDSFSVKSGKDPNLNLFSDGFREARRRLWLSKINLVRSGTADTAVVAQGSGSE